MVEENEYAMGNRFCLNRKTGIWMIENVVLTPTKPAKDDKEKTDEKIEEKTEQKEEESKLKNDIKKLSES